MTPVVATRRKVHHGVHFLLTILTGGLWAVVWFFDWLLAGKR